MTFDEFKKAAKVKHWDFTQKGTIGSQGTDITYGKFTMREYVTLERARSNRRGTLYMISGKTTSYMDFLTQLAEQED